MPSWRTTLLPTGVALAVAVPFAVAAGGEDAGEEPAARAAATGDVLREGRRNPATGDARRETELIGDIDANEGGSGPGKDGFVLRESNLSTTGGGPVHGCRAVKGNIDTTGFNASARDTKPCIRVNNLSGGPNGGRAFEFAFGGPLGGLFEHSTGGDGASPFSTNATGVARGLNADRLDSREASDFLLRTQKAADSELLDGKDSTEFLGRTEKAADAETVDGIDGADIGERLFAVVDADGTLARGAGAIEASRGGTGNYVVRFDGDITACAYVASIGLSGDAGSETNSSIDTVRANGTTDSVFVDTEDFGGTQQDRGFHLIVMC